MSMAVTVAVRMIVPVGLLVVVRIVMPVLMLMSVLMLKAMPLFVPRLMLMRMLMAAMIVLFHAPILRQLRDCLGRSIGEPCRRRTRGNGQRQHFAVPHNPYPSSRGPGLDSNSRVRMPPSDAHKPSSLKLGWSSGRRPKGQ